MPAMKRPAAQAIDPKDEEGHIGKTSSQTMLRSLEAMKAQGREFPLMDYKAQRTWAAKRAWASKFTLDETC
eukprot:9870226-Lingulodinium_polyedra.AAC.1